MRTAVWTGTRPEPARFADPALVLADALEAARISEPMAVSEAALAYRVLENPGGGYSGPYTFDAAPHTRRPMDCLNLDSGYSVVAVMGPSQCYKSTIGDNWTLHTVCCDPADMIMVLPNKDIMRSYVVTQINKMIRTSAEMKRRQLQTPSADNIFSKEFEGCHLLFVWPVASQLRARPVPRWRVDDLDAVPENIDEEGSVISLLTGRQATFEGYDMGYVNSSPSLGSTRGIEVVVTGGTDEWWFVDCLHCGAPFRLAFFEVMHFEKKGTADDARRTASVVCPDCGAAHEQGDKAALMARGRWVGTGQRALPATGRAPVPGAVDGALAPNRTAGFHFDGLMGARSWGFIAEQYRAAELTFELNQDEGELRAVTNTSIGVNYRSREDGAKPVTADDLATRVDAARHEAGQVPPGVVCLTAAVDVQGNRFEVLVQGWGANFESCVIDRFPIVALDDGRTAVNPARHPEHWRALLQKVIWATYPLASGGEYRAPIVSMAIDTGGEDGVTDNAFEFFYAALRLGVPPGAITLIKGGNNPRARLLPPPTIDAKRKKRRSDPDAELFVPNVHRFKDMIDVRLRRERPGPGFIHLPAGFDRKYLDEATAEVKEDGVWTRLRGRANETLDLLVYNAVVVTRFAGRDGAMDWVPKAFRIPQSAVPAPEPDPPAAEDDTDTDTGTEPVQGPAPPPAPPVTPPPDHPHARSGRRRRGVRGRADL